MEQLNIGATIETPEIFFDADKGVFSITGKSYPENVNDFYKKIFDYIELYKENPMKKTTLDFNWLYYNTATSKVIVKIILGLKDVSKKFEVNWLCKKNFELMIEKGEELKEVLGVDLNIVYL